MKIKLALFCLGLATAAFAEDGPKTLAPQPQTPAPSAGLKATAGIAAPKPAGIRRAPSPSVSETRVTRQPDGSLVMNCVQKPNPKVREQMAAQQAAQSVEPQQP